MKAQNLGLFLIVVSFLPPIAIFSVVPLLPLSLAQKALLVPLLGVMAELMFWLGLLLVGKEAAQKYRRYLSFRRVWNWMKRKLRRNL